MPAGADGPFPVITVVDGDTVKVDEAGTTVTVRLIGMDTPETKDPRKPVQCYGPEASARAVALLTGRSAYLEYDPSQDRLDKYGRTLAYLWIADGTFYNETMIREGYAHEYTYDRPYKYQARFRAAEAAARAARAGLWSPNTCNGDTTHSTARPQPTPADTPPAALPPATMPPATVYYPNCAAARAAGAAPLHAGQPGYRPGLDRDGDGVACES